MPLAELYVTDGTTTVDLLGDGLCLTDWRPSYPGMKGGGTWQSSPLADGRRLAQYRYNHVVDVFTLNGRGFTQDAMIRQLQELNRLLIKARQYWTADWQDEPVYLVAKSGRETNTRYALIHSYDFPQDGAPYGQPFAKNWGRIGMEGLTLAVEHALWQSTIPGEGDCTEVYATEDYEASVTIEEHVIQSTDDAKVEEVVNTITLGGTSIAFGRAAGTGNDENIGMRFQTVGVPQGATILWAYVQFQAGQTNGGVTVNTLVSCEDADDTITFFAGAPGFADFMGRPRTAGVAWSPGAWTMGQFYYTPDIATEVQTVVDRVGWAANNNMVVFVDEDGSTAAGTRRRPAAWDNVTYLEPVLFIGYTSDVTYGRERGGVCLVGDPEKHVVASTDDCWVEEVVNTINLAGGLWFGIRATGNDLNTGMRFQGVNIPQGATILYAYVRFQCNNVDALVTVNVLVRCEDVDDAATFSTYVDFMGRPRTVGVPWSPGAWVVGTFYDTPDIASQVQVVVSRPGWVSGNDLVVFVDEDGSTGANRKRQAASWDDATLMEPVLFIGYSNQGQTFVANKDVMANIDHIYWYDASALMWSGNLVGTMPYSLFRPGVAIATGDYALFGIETVTGAGPYTYPSFANLVYDLIPAVYTGNATMAWSCSNGAGGWAGLAMVTSDHTAAAVNEPLSVAGVCSLHWDVPASWLEDPHGPMATTCLWIKLQATVPAAPADSISVPQQQNRDVYHVAWPYVEIASEDVGGDIPALIRTVLANPSFRVSASGYEIEEMVIGLRSLSRGTDFTAYLNCGDEQNHADVTLTPVHGGASFTTEDASSAGRAMQWISGGAIAALTHIFTIRIASALSAQYYGSYRAFIRYYPQTLFTMTLQLQIQSGTGGSAWIGPEVNTFTWWPAIIPIAVDLGSFTLPATAILRPSEYQDWIDFQIYGTATGALTTDFFDLILIPVDEWAGTFRGETYGGSLTDSEGLHIDSVHHPKRDIRTVLFDDIWIWETLANGPMVLQANSSQRLWFFVTEIHASDRSYPSVCMTADIDRAQRYLSMRGDR